MDLVWDGLGLDYGEVALAPSDPRWPEAFARVADKLRSALGDAVAGVEHVGSTSVPMPAKPILDVAIGLASTADLQRVIPALEQLGFQYRGDNGDDGGHLFLLNARPEHRVAHVHVVQFGDRNWRRYLAFRDRLRADPVARDRYEDVKRELAIRFPHDRQSYTAGKSAFISDLLDPHAPPPPAPRPSRFVVATVDKVVAYIVRGDRMVAFLHEEDADPVLGSGLQVPTGTVHDGEDPAVAVLREAREETGLEDLRIVRYLGSDTVMWPGKMAHARHFYALESPGAPAEWRHVERDEGDGDPRPFRLFWIPVEHAGLLAAAQGVFAFKLQ